VVVGDQKKFLAALVTLKNDVDPTGAPVDKLSQEALDALKAVGIEGVKLVRELSVHEKFKKLVDEAIEKANAKAISRAHHIRKWILLETDLSISGNELTPTLKIKRNEVQKKYFGVIEKLYVESKL